MTALASLPAERLKFLLASQLVAVLDSRDEDAGVIAAVAAATPYLFFERRDLWDRLAKRILGGDGGAISARALARGLATLWPRGLRRDAIEGPLRALREMARRAGAGSLDDSRRWIEVIAVTDLVDGAERDPLDLEHGLENLVRVAAQYDDEEADARAARFAVSLAPHVLGSTSNRPRYGAASPASRGDQRRRRVRARVCPAPVGDRCSPRAPREIISRSPISKRRGR